MKLHPDVRKLLKVAKKLLTDMLLAPGHHRCKSMSGASIIYVTDVII